MQFIFTCKQVVKKKKKEKETLPILTKITAIAWDIYSESRYLSRLH